MIWNFLFLFILNLIELFLFQCEIPAAKPQNCFQRFADEHMDTDKDGKMNNVLFLKFFN